jgi:uncharacterized cupin superfamily protein
MKRIAVDAVAACKGSQYPAPYDQPCRERVRCALGARAGLTDFGVNRLELPPGSWSSQRHWHRAEDEFVWVLSGQVVLVTDEGEELLQAGDCAGFKAGERNAHHLQNRSAQLAVLLEIGSRRPLQDAVEYPDIDLRWADEHYLHRDGADY